MGCEAAGGPRLVNSYGLTETTIDSCYYEGPAAVTAGGVTPIGRPFPGVRLYVLDGQGEPVPGGVPGELAIGGAGVARGYADGRLDAGKYLADPFAPGGRLYRTGDRVRRRADGNLEFLGRLDEQIKIRGFRVEPGELEQVLREQPGVADAAAVVRERGPGDPRLAAYVVLRAGATLSADELRRALRGRLPEYLLPSAVTFLAALPRTTSEKIDRRRLPEPD